MSTDAESPATTDATSEATTDTAPDSEGVVSAPVATGYAAAQQELESILSELERADVDVDRLAAQVKRAAELIEFCRARISSARIQIDHVVGNLGDDRS